MTTLFSSHNCQKFERSPLSYAEFEQEVQRADELRALDRAKTTFFPKCFS